MTREEAKQALAKTQCFERVGDFIALREVMLIEAVRAHQASYQASLMDLAVHPEVNPPRSA